MKKNKVIFLATEIILCVLALFFTFKMFDQNETEKKVAVIVQNSGDKNWDSFIKGLKESAKVNNIHLIICNADEINNIDDQKELILQRRISWRNQILHYSYGSCIRSSTHSFIKDEKW